MPSVNTSIFSLNLPHGTGMHPICSMSVEEQFPERQELIPEDFWQSFFLIGHQVLTKLWGPLVGPAAAAASFACSAGNVLWHPISGIGESALME